jgi:FkbM family methyltransferase
MKSLRAAINARVGRRSAATALDLELLRRLVGPRPDIFLEIGANSGSDTLRMLAAFPSVGIHAFEPDARAKALFRENVMSNRVILHELAITAADGPVTFFASDGAPDGHEAEFPDGWHLSGSTRPPVRHLDQHPWCKFREPVTVDGLSLDTWSERHSVHYVDFIWADVQGAERDLILGGSRLLQSTRFLYTEYNDAELYEGQPSLSEILGLLPGWTVVRQYPNDVLLRNESIGSPSDRRGVRR